MSELRELTDAELDIVGGRLTKIGRPEPVGGGAIKLVEEIIFDILRILEPKQPVRAKPM
jgi:hypothetical protein